MNHKPFKNKWKHFIRAEIICIAIILQLIAIYLDNVYLTKIPKNDESESYYTIHGWVFYRDSKLNWKTINMCPAPLASLIFNVAAIILGAISVFKIKNNRLLIYATFLSIIGNIWLPFGINLAYNVQQNFGFPIFVSTESNHLALLTRISHWGISLRFGIIASVLHLIACFCTLNHKIELIIHWRSYLRKIVIGIAIILQFTAFLGRDIVQNNKENWKIMWGLNVGGCSNGKYIYDNDGNFEKFEAFPMSFVVLIAVPIWIFTIISWIAAIISLVTTPKNMHVILSGVTGLIAYCILPIAYLVVNQIHIKFIGMAIRFGFIGSLIYFIVYCMPLAKSMGKSEENECEKPNQQIDNV